MSRRARVAPYLPLGRLKAKLPVLTENSASWLPPMLRQYQITRDFRVESANSRGFELGKSAPLGDSGKWPGGGKIAALRPIFRGFPTIFSGNFRI